MKLQEACSKEEYSRGGAFVYRRHAAGSVIRNSRLEDFEGWGEVEKDHRRIVKMI